MAKRITFQTSSIAAGATSSLQQISTDFNKLKTDTVDRVLIGVGFAGATVNTGSMVGYAGNEEIFRMPNGVTNTTGAPIKQDDVTTMNEIISENENFDCQITNTSGGALQYYVYFEFAD